MDTGVTILLVVVMLHFVVGFGYLVYKLSPQKKPSNSENKTKELHDKE